MRPIIKCGVPLALSTHLLTILSRSLSALRRGHGTFVQDEKLVATISGVVERVNKLVSVRPLKSRYAAEHLCSLSASFAALCLQSYGPC
jgi:hypothetical protein